MDPLSAVGNVLLNIDRNQSALLNTVTQLSSGLRINSAADDPSGNAIAQNLTTKVNGLQQSVTNVQNANNALNVANGALASIQTILERVNSLIVESNSDVNSTQDLEDIQTEINSLLTEINRIGQNTNFNGLPLLNGAFDDSTGSNATIAQVASPFGTGSTMASSYLGTGQAGPLVFDAGVPSTAGYNTPALMVFTVTGYSSNAVDPDSGSAVGPGVYVQFDAYSSAGAAAFGAAPLYQDVSAIAVNQGPIYNAQYVTPNGNAILLEFSLANLTQADVGATIAFVTTAGTAPSNGTPLSVNDGGSEGETVGITLPTINTNALGISDISVLDPQTVNYQNQTTGVQASNNVAASYSEVLVQNALTSITTAEAKIGAQTVALNDDETDDNTAIVNYQQSVSQLADLNVGQATTQYTQEQILTDVGTSVLAQMQNDAKAVTALLIQALVA
jgi:flagellin